MSPIQEYRQKTQEKHCRSLVWSVALYGAETWTLSKTDLQKLEAFEMWVWTRIERISYTEHMSNEALLKQIEDKRALVTTIHHRQKNWIGHILRGEGLIRDLFESRLLGARPKGRPRMKMLDNLIGRGSYGDLKTRAEDREIWRSWEPETCQLRQSS